MQSSPQVHEYAQAYSLGQLSAHTLIALHERFPGIYPALLHSAAITDGSYDVLMAFPSASLTLTGAGKLYHSDYEVEQSDFLSTLDKWWKHSSVPQMSTSLPFSGGWFVFLGYELAAQIEPSLRLSSGTIDEVVAQAVRVPVAIVRNSVTEEAWLVVEHGCEHHKDQIESHINEIKHLYHQSKQEPFDVVLEEEQGAQFIGSVKRAKEYIAAGDIYQANLSRGWHASLPQLALAADIYQQLCKANPAPFAGLVRLSNGDYIISSSPERLIRVRNGEVSTRPIAGTRPRSQDQQRDLQLIDELRNHPKEQAEHIMLLDLERNDLGRLCESGTVKVDEYMTVESYAHVHHIVSNVSGRLRSDVTPGQAIAAVFPGGTITGCPKVRCMQIIAELEHVRRGAYTGSMGYLNRDGSMDLNILIRTLQLRGQQLGFRAGAGIVADSIPEKELEETRAKALGMIRALGASC